MKIILTALTLMISLSPEAFARNKAIYGSFDNQFVSHSSPENIIKQATGVAYLTPKSLIKKVSTNNSVIKAISLKKQLNLCSNERFSGNLASLHSCTGFLVEKDILVTAGHCIKTQSDCDKFAVAFGVSSAKEDTDEGGFLIPTAAIYSCKKILKAYDEDDTNYDYSVIQLDRKASARYVFTLGDDSYLNYNSSVYMLGHPLGLPLTHTQPAPVTSIYSDYTFKTTLDSFAGNSGSPVINAKNGNVVGILTGGQEDFPEEGKGCKKYSKHSSGGETVTRINLIRNFIEIYKYNNY